MKALVTGGTGFVGRPVVDRLLAEGHTVRLFCRKPPDDERFRSRDIEIVRGDLEKISSLIDALDGIDVLFHIGEIKNTTKAAARKNIDLVEAVAERCAEKGLKRFVFISSITVAGIPSTIPATEETEPRVSLSDHYTAYKSRCEKILAEKASVFGWEYSIVRPAPVYGHGSRYLSGLVNAVDTLGPICLPFVGDGKNIAPLIHVKDLADAIFLSGFAPEAAGQVFNLTDGLDHTWLDFFKSIADALGRSVRVCPIPPPLLKLAAAPLDPLSGLFGMSLDALRYVDYFSKDLHFDNAKAKKLLSWRSAYSLADGVREMVEYYRAGE